jgi:hypothetical protein
VLGVAATEVFGTRGRDPEHVGVDLRGSDDAAVHGPDVRGRGRGQLVQPVVTAEDPRIGAPPGQHAGHDRRHPGIGTADGLGRRLHRVGERTQDVERSGDGELAPRPGGVTHGRVERRGEAEGDPDLFCNVCHLVGPQIQADAESLEHVGGPGLRGRRPVAVLDHPRTGSGGHDRGHGRDVHAHGTVTAGSDHVQRPAGDRQRRGDGVHRVEQAGDLLDGLPLAAQGHREPGDLRGRRCLGQDLAHGPRRLVGGQVVTLDERAEHLGPGG